MPGVHRFTAPLERFGTLYGVMVPAAVSRAVGVRGRVPVEARLGRALAVRATLIPSGNGRHRIHFNARTRSDAGAAIGKRVAIVIRVDDGKRDVPIPDDLARALRDERLEDTWSSMPPGKREHILDWIERAVHERTRESRIAKTIEVTHARRERALR